MAWLGIITTSQVDPAERSSGTDSDPAQVLASQSCWKQRDRSSFWLMNRNFGDLLLVSAFVAYVVEDLALALRMFQEIAVKSR